MMPSLELNPLRIQYVKSEWRENNHHKNVIRLQEQSA